MANLGSQPKCRPAQGWGSRVPSFWPENQKRKPQAAREHRYTADSERFGEATSGSCLRLQTSLEPGVHRQDPTAKGLETKLFPVSDGPLGTAYLEQMQMAKGTKALKTELILMAHRLGVETCGLNLIRSIVS